MRRRIETASTNTAVKDAVKEECSHYWLIGSPLGHTTRGVCKKCGQVREFINYWPDSLWDSNVASFLKQENPPDDDSNDGQNEK